MNTNAMLPSLSNMNRNNMNIEVEENLAFKNDSKKAYKQFQTDQSNRTGVSKKTD